MYLYCVSGSGKSRVGEPVPMGYSPSMIAAVGDTMTTEVEFTEYTISRPALLYAVEFYATMAGDYVWEVHSCIAPISHN